MSATVTLSKIEQKHIKDVCEAIEACEDSENYTLELEYLPLKVTQPLTISDLNYALDVFNQVLEDEVLDMPREERRSVKQAAEMIEGYYEHCKKQVQLEQDEALATLDVLSIIGDTE